MVFFQSIFGYLVFCIIYKWSIDWPGLNTDAPALLNMLIFMFLSPGNIEGTPLFRGQAYIQVTLLLLAVSMIPVLLLLKPLWLRYENNKARALGYRGIGETSRVSALDGDDDDTVVNGERDDSGSYHDATAMITQNIGEDEEHEEFEFSEAMIHQTIHTIGKPIRPTVPSSADHHRILFKLCLAHGVIPPSLGLVPCPSAAVHCTVDHDALQIV
jgi:V-type H+-transporting ATPase subunit a